MAEDYELLKQKIELIERENKILKESVGLEFEKVQKAFSQMGNLLDLLFLEESSLLDILIKKSTFSREEFTALMEENYKKVQASIDEAEKVAKAKEEKSPIIT